MGAVPEGDSLKILFVMEHPGVGSLCRHSACCTSVDTVSISPTTRSSRSSPIVSCRGSRMSAPGSPLASCPPAVHSGWAALAAWLRRSIDYLRYLEPRYGDATKLRARARRKAPKAMRLVGRVARLTGPLGVAGLRRTLQAVERCLARRRRSRVSWRSSTRTSCSRRTSSRSGRPTPTTCGRRSGSGIRTVFPVRGWDNLTNKGLLRDAPDQVFVWNDLQAREAVELHRVPAEHIRAGRRRVV